MRTYKETIDWLANQSYHRLMNGSDSPFVGRYETTVVGFIYGVDSTKIFDDVLDTYNTLFIKDKND